VFLFVFKRFVFFGGLIAGTPVFTAFDKKLPILTAIAVAEGPKTDRFLTCYNVSNCDDKTGKLLNGVDLY
jgi:hypothetical protein